MKKIILILAVTLSIGALAQGGIGHNMSGSGSLHNGRGMMMQVENLTPEQQVEFDELHDEYRTEMQRSMLDIEEVNLKIQREMAADKPDQKNINKLIDQKTKLQSEHQKEMKERFDVDMMGGMNGNMMGM